MINFNSSEFAVATTSYPIRGIAKDYKFMQLGAVPYMFELDSGHKSITTALREAFGGAAVKIKDFFDGKSLNVVDPEYLSEDKVLYNSVIKSARESELLFTSKEHEVRKGENCLYVFDKGTRMPVIVYLK